MSAIGEFTGLPMPVFTAFGWSGEEAAIQFALTHLDTFIKTLHSQLSQEAKLELPVFGINQEAQLAYLATHRDPEDGPYLAFSARPNFLEMRLVVTNRLVVHRALRMAEKEPERWYERVKLLGPKWAMQIEQRLIEEESGVESHYSDLYKDSLSQLDFENSKTIMSRAAFLNGEEKWLIPMYFSYRLNSMDASSMNSKLIPHMATAVDEILPIIRTYSRKQGARSGSKNGSARVVKRSNGVTKTTRPTARTKAAEPPAPPAPKTFSHEVDLKPLHLRKGFINLTAYHWEFFADGPRSETRAITLFFEDQVDKESTVWRLQPNNIARIMLSETAHGWFQDKLSPNTRISITATKLSNNEIEVKIGTA